MKLAIEGLVIGTEKTQKGGNINTILTNPHPQTKAQDVYKVYGKDALEPGGKFKGVVRANVDLWFLDA